MIDPKRIIMREEDFEMDGEMYTKLKVLTKNNTVIEVVYSKEEADLLMFLKTVNAVSSETHISEGHMNNLLNLVNKCLNRSVDIELKRIHKNLKH